MKPSHILAIDQGTTSSRAIVFDRRLKVVGVAQKEFRQHFPKPGWVEHDPEEIWKTRRRHLPRRDPQGRHQAGRRSPPSASPTSARRWSSGTARPASRSTAPSSGRTGAPPTPAPRSAPPATRPRSPRRTGLLLDPYFSGTKVAWLLDHVKGARATGRARRALLRHDRHLPDLAADRRQGPRHRRHQRLAHAALRHPHGRLGRRAAGALRRARARILPEVRDCAADYGVTDKAILGAAIPILGVAGDQQAATVGQACFEPGMLKSTYGTGCFALLNTGRQAVRSRNRLLTTIAYQLDGKRTYALEGSIFIAGAAVQWLRDGLKIIKRAAETAELARKADPEQQRLSRAGLRRPRRAVLGRRRARRDLRPHPRHDGGRVRPRRAGSRSATRPATCSRPCAATGGGGGRRAPSCASTAAWSPRTGRCSSSPTSSTRRSTGRRSWRRRRSAPPISPVCAPASTRRRPSSPRAGSSTAASRRRWRTGSRSKTRRVAGRRVAHPQPAAVLTVRPLSRSAAGI